MNKKNDQMKKKKALDWLLGKARQETMTRGAGPTCEPEEGMEGRTQMRTEGHCPGFNSRSIWVGKEMLNTT